MVVQPATDRSAERAEGDESRMRPSPSPLHQLDAEQTQGARSPSTLLSQPRSQTIPNSSPSRSDALLAPWQPERWCRKLLHSSASQLRGSRRVTNQPTSLGKPLLQPRGENISPKARPGPGHSGEKAPGRLAPSCKGRGVGEHVPQDVTAGLGMAASQVPSAAVPALLSPERWVQSYTASPPARTHRRWVIWGPHRPAP